jgi:hypothetical protein
VPENRNDLGDLFPVLASVLVEDDVENATEKTQSSSGSIRERLAGLHRRIDGLRGAARDFRERFRSGVDAFSASSPRASDAVKPVGTSIAQAEGPNSWAAPVSQVRAARPSNPDVDDGDDAHVGERVDDRDESVAPPFAARSKMTTMSSSALRNSAKSDVSAPAEDASHSDIASTRLTPLASQLTQALRVRGIDIEDIDPMRAAIGPRVVRFRARLAPGEGLSRVQGVVADLARELALPVPPIIDNIAGEPFIGIDVPHPSPPSVPLIPALRQIGGRPEVLPIPVGVKPSGEAMWLDLTDLPHLLVAGSTRRLSRGSLNGAGT